MRYGTGEGRTVQWDFEVAKIADVSECRAAASHRMVKRMVRRDSVHRIGVGRDIQRCLRECDMS